MCVMQVCDASVCVCVQCTYGDNCIWNRQVLAGSIFFASDIAKSGIFLATIDVWYPAGTMGERMSPIF